MVERAQRANTTGSRRPKNHAPRQGRGERAFRHPTFPISAARSRAGLARDERTGAQLGLPRPCLLRNAQIVCDQLLGREVLRLLVNAGLRAPLGFHAFVFFKFHRQ